MADSQGSGAPNGGTSGPYQGPRAHVPEPTYSHDDDPGYVTRTKFLSGVAIAGGVVLTAAILVPLVGFAVADSVKEEEWRWIDVGPLSNFPDGQTASIAVSGPSPQSDRRVFVRHKDGEIIGIWNRCAHLGCPVEYVAAGDNYICPCHGGAYDSLGKVTAGPPPRPLDRMDVKVVDAAGKDKGAPSPKTAGAWVPPASPAPDDRLLIGRAFSIDENQNPYSLHDPGEDVTGVLANLYPF